MDATVDTNSRLSSPPGKKICRVPDRLLKVKPEAYQPCLIPIGPFHRSKITPKIKGIEVPGIKEKYLNRLLGRLITSSSELGTEQRREEKKKTLKECYLAAAEALPEAEKYYELKKGEQDADPDVTKEMLVLDGCFILELLCTAYQKEPSSDPSSHSREQRRKEDPIFGTPHICLTVQLDLLMLENQLPFFVLQRLFDCTVAKITDRSLDEYVFKFFGNLMTFDHEPNAKRSQPEVTIYHLLHLIQSQYCPPSQGQQSQGQHCTSSDLHFTSKYSASDLIYNGIKFMKIEEKEPFNMEFKEDIYPICWFKRARLRVPALGIYDSTETFLRNLIAFEQCFPNDITPYVTSYAFLLNMLVQKERDVEMLANDKIIHNNLGANDSATKLFKNLCTNVIMEEFCFSAEWSKVVKYRENWWPPKRAYVRRKYLAGPWTFMAFTAGFIAFAITVASFILSLL
ncbi:hypothetical protein NMG60_11014984 [Bertholletia excelsa]